MYYDNIFPVKNADCISSYSYFFSFFIGSLQLLFVALFPNNSFVIGEANRKVAPGIIIYFFFMSWKKLTEFE